MNIDTFNYLYSETSLNPESLKILYNFKDYTASTNNILSIKDGNAFYSGTIYGDFDTFTGKNSGSGYFDQNSIHINESTGLFSPNSLFLFSQEKVDNSAGTIFSNYSGGSGFEFGINNANKLYFKSNYLGAPYIHTLNNIPTAKNIYAVGLNSASVDLLRYTPYNNALDGKNFGIDPISLTNTKNWTIGSGEYAYKGYLDTFVYISQTVNATEIKSLASSVVKVAYSNPAITGAFSGLITGIHSTSTGISGVIGYLTGITGYRTGSGAFTYKSGTPLTGCVTKSGRMYIPRPADNLVYSGADSYLGKNIYQVICAGLSGDPDVFSGEGFYFTGNSGIFNGETGYCAASSSFGITGFSIKTLHGAFTDVTELVGITGQISGIVSEEVTTSGLRGPMIFYTGTGAYTGISGFSDESFYPNSYFYTDNRQPNYFVESILLNSGNNINKKALTTSSPQMNKTTFVLDEAYDPNTLNVAFNGISLLSGKASTIQNKYNQTIVSVDEDYFMTGDIQLFVGLDIVKSDEGIYDINQSGNNARTTLTITETDQYDDAPFAQINLTGTQVFFNGVKLYSGVDYYGRDGKFLPTGYLTGITGTYFTYPQYTGLTSITTGQGLSGYFDLNQPIQFVPNSRVFYINGIRQDPDIFIECSSGVDLLQTGKQVFNRYSKEIYFTQSYNR